MNCVLFAVLILLDHHVQFLLFRWNHYHWEYDFPDDTNITRAKKFSKVIQGYLDINP